MKLEYQIADFPAGGDPAVLSEHLHQLNEKDGWELVSACPAVVPQPKPRLPAHVTRLIFKRDASLIIGLAKRPIESVLRPFEKEGTA